MNYLFFDTETTGLPRNYKAPVSDLDNWPRVVQLAWLVADDSGDIISQESHIIRPDGFSIPEAAAAIHGINDFRAQTEGEDLKAVLESFNRSLQAVSTTLVAHNLSFDISVLGAEFLRSSLATDIFNLTTVCTMKSSIDFCNLPNKKYPKLVELHYKLFNEGFDGAHDA